MPRPRAAATATGQKSKHFEVMPWQSKRIRTAEEPEGDRQDIILAPDTSDAVVLPHRQSELSSFSNSAEVLHQSASLFSENCVQQDFQGDVYDADVQPANEQHTIEEVVVCDTPTAQEPAKTQAELLRQCSFDEYQLPPLQPARAHLTHHGGLHTDNTKPLNLRQGPTPPSQQHPAISNQPGLSQQTSVEVMASPSELGTTVNSSRLITKQPTISNAAVTACHQDRVEGRCRLAMLPGRLGWSGHVVDANTHACIGVMGEKVGGSPQGDMCGMDDDEEMLKVTLVRFSRRVLETGRQDIVTYVISCGGDMPRWKAAETAHLERYGLLDGNDLQHQLVPVSFESECLLEGPEADRQLRGFAKKLVGSGASVVMGQMRLMGLNNDNQKDGRP